VEFYTEVRNLGLDLSKSVVFIDELIQNSNTVKVLHNICRAVHFPVILSGTNSKVQNLIATGDILMSRSGDSLPWVQVVTKLPKAKLSSIGTLVSFKPVETDTVTTLNNYITPSGSSIGYSALARVLLSEQDLRTVDWNYLESLLNFAIKQSKTSLPGIAILSFKFFIEIIVSLRGNGHRDNFSIWASLLSKIQAEVSKRKRKILNSEGHMSSAHILTFPSGPKRDHQSGALAGLKVDNHFFYFGLPDDVGIFRLSTYVDEFDNLSFERDGSIYNEWKDHCYFPLLKTTFLQTCSHGILGIRTLIMPLFATSPFPVCT